MIIFKNFKHDKISIDNKGSILISYLIDLNGINYINNFSQDKLLENY